MVSFSLSEILSLPDSLTLTSPSTALGTDLDEPAASQRSDVQAYERRADSQTSLQ